MKIPKRIKEFIQKKQSFLDTKRGEVEQYVIKQQGNFLDALSKDIVIEFEVKNGKIVDSPHNYRMLAEVDRVFKSWSSMFSSTLTSKIIGTTDEIVGLSAEYFKSMFGESLPARFDKVVQGVQDKINSRIGINSEGTVKNGWLDGLFKDNTVPQKVKDYMAKAITGQINQKDFMQGLKDIVKGVPKDVIKDGKVEKVQTGAFERQYRQYAYDIYQQYDRSFGNSLAGEFDMNYFIYQGGLIDDSRDFCAAHNGKVWSRAEAKDWPEWTPSKGEYPAGYEVRQKDIYEVPSYIRYPGYDPLIDAGGYNCRHTIAWIGDELAFELRPELNTKATQ